MGIAVQFHAGNAGGSRKQGVPRTQEREKDDANRPHIDGRCLLQRHKEDLRRTESRRASPLSLDLDNLPAAVVGDAHTRVRFGVLRELLLLLVV